MPLNQDIEAFLDIANQSANSQLAINVDTIRENYNQTALVLDDYLEANTHDISIKTRDDETITIREYDNVNSSDTVMLFFHGGGYVLGSLESHQTLCIRMSNELKCNVYSVDYRLAPEHKFPTAFEDACDAYQWLIDNILTKQKSFKNIIVAGDSVGATLATNICIEARSQIKKDSNWIIPTQQILMYPCTSAYQESESHHKFASGYLLEYKTLQWMFSQYLKSEEERLTGIFAPLQHDDLSQLPDSLIILAEYDPLVDEGHQYAKKLRSAGNKVKTIEYKGLTHDFARFGNLIPDEVEKLCNDFKEFIYSE